MKSDETIFMRRAFIGNPGSGLPGSRISKRNKIFFLYRISRFGINQCRTIGNAIEFHEKSFLEFQQTFRLFLCIVRRSQVEPCRTCRQPGFLIGTVCKPFLKSICSFLFCGAKHIHIERSDRILFDRRNRIAGCPGRYFFQYQFIV